MSGAKFSIRRLFSNCFAATVTKPIRVLYNYHLANYSCSSYKKNMLSWKVMPSKSWGSWKNRRSAGGCLDLLEVLRSKMTPKHSTRGRSLLAETRRLKQEGWNWINWIWNTWLQVETDKKTSANYIGKNLHDLCNTLLTVENNSQSETAGFHQHFRSQEKRRNYFDGAEDDIPLSLIQHAPLKVCLNRLIFESEWEHSYRSTQLSLCFCFERAQSRHKHVGEHDESPCKICMRS